LPGKADLQDPVVDLPPVQGVLDLQLVQEVLDLVDPASRLGHQAFQVLQAQALLPEVPVHLEVECRRPQLSQEDLELLEAECRRPQLYLVDLVHPEVECRRPQLYREDLVHPEVERRHQQLSLLAALVFLQKCEIRNSKSTK